MLSVMIACPLFGQDSAPNTKADPERQWIEGRIVVPRRTPESEQLFVTARSDQADEEAFQRVEVSKDGKFRVSFVAGVRTVELKLSGKFLYEEPIRVELPHTGPALTIKPKLGGRVSGTIVLPPGVDAGEIVGSPLLLLGHMRKTMASSYGRTVVIGDDLTFAFDALPAPADIDVSYSWKGHPTTESDDLLLQKAKEIAIDLQLLEGASVHGRLVDHQGEPVADAIVWCGNPGRPRGVRNVPASMKPTLTTAAGEFELSGIEAGELTVRAYKAGFLPSSSRVDAADGDRVENVELSLQLGGALRGRLRDEAGAPQAGVWIGLEHSESGTGRASSCRMSGKVSSRLLNGKWTYEHQCIVASTLTKSDGQFEFESLEIQELKLLATGDESGELGRVEVIDQVTPGGEFLELECSRLERITSEWLAERELSSVSGRVLGPDSKPVSRALVTAAWQDLPRKEFDPASVANLIGSLQLSVGFDATALTDDEGHFRLALDRPGVALVFVRANELAPARKSVRVIPGTDPKLKFELVQPGTLRGMATQADGAPAGSYFITAHNLTRGEVVEGRTGKLGMFKFENLDPGYWRIDLFRRKASPKLLAQTSALVESGAITDAELSMQRAPVRISGMTTLDARPLESARLIFASLDNDVVEHVEIPFTDYDGWYEAELASPGLYRAYMERGGVFITSTHRIPATPVHELDLEIPAGTLSGRVTTPEGKPVKNAPVLAFSLLTDQPRKFRATIDVHTDEQGNFQFSDLPPDTYRIATGPRTEYLEWTHLGLGNAIAAEVELKARSSVSGIELELPATHGARGVVLDECGEGVRGAEVYGAVGGILISGSPLVLTNEQGGFSINELGENVELFATTRFARSRATRREGDDHLELVLEPATLLNLVAVDEYGVDGYVEVRLVGEDGAESPVQQLSRGAIDLDTDNIALGPLQPGTYTLFAEGRTGRRVGRTIVVAGEAELALTLDF